MKKYNLLNSFLLLAMMLLSSVSCSRDNDIVVPQTKVDKLPAQTVNIGDSITITGENIHLITKVLFGETPAENINTQLGSRDRRVLKVAVPAFTETSKVAVTAIYNTRYPAVVCDEMEVYVPPVIPVVTSEIPSEAMVGEIITLNGTDLNIIKQIFLNETEVPVRSKDITVLTFIIPDTSERYTASVKLVYDNSLGDNQVLNVSGSMIINPIPPVIPAVTSALPAEAMVGETVTLAGTDLHIIKSIWLNDTEVAISAKTETAISFVAPATETELTMSVKLVYDNSVGMNQELAVSGSIRIIPAVMPARISVWKDVMIGGQTTGLSFFNATNGQIVTPCDLFNMQEMVDFMMNVSSSGEIQLYSPANATNILKNQKCGDLLLGVMDETGDNKSYASFLSVVSKFRLLVTTSSAQNTLIGKVLAGDVTDLDDAAFEGISAPSSSAPKNPQVDNVFWFKNEKKGKNGLVHIKALLPDTEAPANSKLKVDIYYQK